VGSHLGAVSASRRSRVLDAVACSGVRLTAHGSPLAQEWRAAEQGDEADEAKHIGASQLIPGVMRTPAIGGDVMLDGLVDAAKALVSAATTLAQVGDARRAKLATYLESVSRVIDGIIERKGKQQKAADLCAELSVYAEHLRELGKATVAKPLLDRLADELVKAQHSRAMLFLSQNPEADSYDSAVDQLSETAGLCRGVATTLRAR
jgi:hypothetical protein